MNVWNFLEDNLGRKVDIGEEHLLKEIARPYILGEVRYVEGF
jgi:predicted nucleotidyltransferase